MGSRSIAAAMLLFLVSPGSAYAGAPLETETARLPPKGTFETDVSLEVQTSSDGHEFASPIALEYSLTDRVTFLAEPVPITTIHPKVGPHASGMGDLELTLTGLLLSEGRSRPAFAIAGEVKFPTGDSPVIGSGKADFTGYGVASKRFGRVDTHVNLGYTVVGHPSGTEVKNSVNYAVAGEYSVAPRWVLVAEVLGNTSSLLATSAPESATTPEISGGETIGMLGARYEIAPTVKGYLGVAVDNNGAVLFRPGLSARF